MFKTLLALIAILPGLALAESESLASGEPIKAVPSEHPELAKLFAEKKVTGTFVVSHLQSPTLAVHNVNRAHKPFIPASTFKIPNSLIALESGAVASIDEIIPYGGKPQFLPQWEHDMPMREALGLSAVPIYQEIARRVGLEKMRAAVKKLNYRNAEIGDVVDRFWLDGPLKISANGQVRFLSDLVEGRLPVKPEHIAAVREITLLEKTDTHELHGKTGWRMGGKPEIGWFVGWVVKGDDCWVFALNIDINEKADGEKRIPLARACLSALGILP